jgi:hypothetical protein
VERLRSAGERRIAFVEIARLGFGGCNYHPSLADDRTIAAKLAQLIDGRRDIWKR